MRDEHGSTLVELLVALSTGMVVMLALVAILEFSTRQAARISDVAQANQLGRTAMTKIVDELHSACIAPSFVPIGKASSESTLWFISGPSEEAVIAAASMAEHEIVWSKTNDTLIEYNYPATKETSWPHFEYSKTASPASGVLLAKNIEQTKSEGKTLPIFQYYSYATTASSGSGAALSTLNPEPLAFPESNTLGSTNAGITASVLIRFTTAPLESTKLLGATGEHTHIALSNQVTLSFSVPRSETTAVDAPCQ